jgi:hypothetical protein
MYSTKYLVAKKEGKVSLLVIMHLIMKKYGGVEV